MLQGFPHFWRVEDEEEYSGGHLWLVKPRIMSNVWKERTCCFLFSDWKPMPFMFYFFLFFFLVQSPKIIHSLLDTTSYEFPCATSPPTAILKISWWLWWAVGGCCWVFLVLFFSAVDELHAQVLCCWARPSSVTKSHLQSFLWQTLSQDPTTKPCPLPLTGRVQVRHLLSMPQSFMDSRININFFDMYWYILLTYAWSHFD